VKNVPYEKCFCTIKNNDKNVLKVNSSCIKHIALMITANGNR